MIVDLHWESLGGHIYFKHIFQYISLKFSLGRQRAIEETHFDIYPFAQSFKTF